MVSVNCCFVNCQGRTRNLLLREHSSRHGLIDGEIGWQMLYDVRLGLNCHLIGVETGYVCHDLHSELVRLGYEGIVFCLGHATGLGNDFDVIRSVFDTVGYKPRRVGGAAVSWS